MATPDQQGFDFYLGIAADDLPKEIDLVAGDLESALQEIGRSALHIPKELSSDRRDEIRHSLIEAMHFLAAHDPMQRIMLYGKRSEGNVEYLVRLEGGKPIKFDEFSAHRHKLGIMNGLSAGLSVERETPGVRLLFYDDKERAA